MAVGFDGVRGERGTELRSGAIMLSAVQPGEAAAYMHSICVCRAMEGWWSIDQAEPDESISVSHDRGLNSARKSIELSTAQNVKNARCPSNSETCLPQVGLQRSRSLQPIATYYSSVLEKLKSAHTAHQSVKVRLESREFTGIEACVG